MRRIEFYPGNDGILAQLCKADGSRYGQRREQDRKKLRALRREIMQGIVCERTAEFLLRLFDGEISRAQVARELGRSRGSVTRLINRIKLGLRVRFVAINLRRQVKVSESCILDPNSNRVAEAPGDVGFGVAISRFERQWDECPSVCDIEGYMISVCRHLRIPRQEKPKSRRKVESLALYVGMRRLDSGFVLNLYDIISSFVEAAALARENAQDQVFSFESMDWVSVPMNEERSAA